MGIEADGSVLADGLNGDDVPDVFWDYIPDEEVDFFAGIDFAAGSAGFDSIAGLGVAGSGFDLDAEESVIEFDDGVIAVTFSPRDANAETEGGGAGQEGRFGGFSEALAIGLGGGGMEGDFFCRGGVLLRIVAFFLHK